MEPELRGNIRELLELTRENNKILHKINNRARWAFFGTLIYWLIVIGVTVGAFYYLQPFFQALLDNYQKSMTLFQQVQSVGTKVPTLHSVESVVNAFGSSTASTSQAVSWFETLLKTLHVQ